MIYFPLNCDEKLAFSYEKYRLQSFPQTWEIIIAFVFSGNIWCLKNEVGPEINTGETFHSP